MTRWFLVNGLLLNASKTEAIAFGTRQQLSKRTDADVRIAFGGTEIVVSDHIKILGVHLDSTLLMKVQVAAVAKACNFHIRALRHIRPLLTKRVAQTISYGMVTARLDYCNSLLQGTSKDNIARLQCVQNSLARVVSRAPWKTPSKPLLCELHWLPVQQRVTYKIGLLVYKTLQSEKPAYLHSLLIPYEPARCLRSKEHSLLTKGHFNTKAVSRAFRHSAPEIWNRLNLNTRCAASLGTFKKLLKTELFTSVFRV